LRRPTLASRQSSGTSPPLVGRQSTMSAVSSRPTCVESARISDLKQAQVPDAIPSTQSFTGRRVSLELAPLDDLGGNEDEF
jgi:hypothetical protein